MLQQDSVMCKNHPTGTDFEGMKGSWKAAEAWHYGRLGKAIDEGAASVAVDSPRLKGPCREVRYHKGSL